MGMSRIRAVVCLSAVILIAGCSNSKNDVSKERLEKMSGGALKKVVPVSGKISVDGKAEKNVNLYLYKQGEFATPVTTVRTGDDGSYCLTTYLTCDGVEAGEYVVTFDYIPKPKKNDSGKDEFKGKYKNPAKSEFKLSVKEGTPQKDVNYELKLK